MATRLTANTVAHPAPSPKKEGAHLHCGWVRQKSAPGKAGRACLKPVYSAVPYVEYLNSGIAFNSSLVALKRA